MTDADQEQIDKQRKSQSIGFLLTIFFGPLGLFYSSWLLAVIICSIGIALAITGMANIITIVALSWPVTIIISLVSVAKYNEGDT